MPQPHLRTPTAAARLEGARLRYLAAQRAADGSAALLRQAAGLTQAELGQRLEVDQPAVHRWERGSRIPRNPHTLRRWLALLDEWEARYGPARAATGTEGARP